MESHLDHAKQAVDAVSAVVVVGALLNYLPAVAALFTIAWTAIRIYETKTIQGWFARRRQKRNRKGG